METFPTPDRRFSQPNRGQYSGNVFATVGVDLTTEQGLLRTSPITAQLFETADDADFAGYAGAIVEFNGKYWAISDKAFVSTSATGTWAQSSTTGADPDTGNTTVDAVVFNGQLLVSGATDIYFNTTGTTWDTNLWWTQELGQSALTNGRHHMRVGPDRNLYITDIDKLYKVDTAGTPNVSTSGDGTLDFSATPLDFTCLEMNSTRAWIGTVNSEGGEAAILEWDLSATSTEPNRVHPIGSSKVMCIAIWNDTPIAILRNGKVKYFNGSSFVDYEGMQFPSAVSDVELEDDFVHPNGWAIIDNYPHFLIKGSIQTSGNAFTDDVSGLWNMPSGVWCLDPEIGLYNRFMVSSGEDSQDDYGQPALRNVGALYAVDTLETKFLASYEVHGTTIGTNNTILSYQDPAHTDSTRNFIVTKFFNPYTDGVTGQLELFFKKLSSGDKIKVWYREEGDSAVTCTGYWYNTTQFNTTDTTGSIEKGNLLWVKAGSGANQISKIASMNTAGTTKEITTEDTILNVSQDDYGAVQLLNFKWFKTIDSTTKIHELFNIPAQKELMKVQFLFEYQPSAGNTIQQEYCIIK